MTVDDALPALASFPGATVVTHRPGRRAVLRTGDGHYVKVVRAPRTDRVDARLRLAGDLVAGVRGAPVVPAVCGRGEGWVCTRPLAGLALHDLLRDDPDAATVLCARAGAALAVLQSLPAPPTLTTHAVDDEVAVLHRVGAPAVAVDDVAARLRALGTRPLAVCHRDLHDKQLLALDDGAVGLIDLDTLCAADPALDVANLLAHLALRVEEGRCAPRTAARAADALLTGMGGAVPDAAALAAYDAATALRLAALRRR